MSPLEAKALFSRLWKTLRRRNLTTYRHGEPRNRQTSSSDFFGSAQSTLNNGNGNTIVVALWSAAGVGIAAGALFYFGPPGLRNALVAQKSALIATSDSATEKRKLTPREKRFIKFASVEYDGQVYMTPQDFLESVVEAEPRPRFKRKRLTAKEVEEMTSRLPRLNKNNEMFFRAQGNQGIISFSEYLFLLTTLIKPQSGFKIAFAMLDQDGNERIDKTEFRVLETVFSSAAKERKQLQLQQGNGSESSSVEDSSGNKPVFDDYEHGLHRAHQVKVDTTLLVYFFGRRGQDQLKFDDFRRFMDNLQTEVLQMEFHEFSKGAQTITELDFARILLRYTFLNSEEYEAILDRLVDRLTENEVGITFDEFKDFCLFLNNLDDFQVSDLFHKEDDV